MADGRAADNLRVVQEVFEALNAHDTDRYVALLDPGFVWESDTLGRIVRGPQEARRAMEMYFDAFPGLHFSVEQMLVCGDDHIVARWRAGERVDHGSPALQQLQRAVTVAGCSVCRILGGRIANIWIYWDSGVVRRWLEDPSRSMTAS
jgi:ketosteroid isomerase-like protein